MPAPLEDRIFKALDSFCIELPSWGFANTGTRFGKFQQAAAATCTEEKFSDAGQVHRFTGCCPTVAVHVLWDFPRGKASAAEVGAMAARHGVRVGSINPNVFQDQASGFFDHYLKGTGNAPAAGSVTAFTQTCPAGAPSGGPYTARSWFALHPGAFRFSSSSSVPSIPG